MIRFTTRISAVASVAAIICAAEPSAWGDGAVAFRIVAATGDTAPGGGSFESFAAPRMSANGRVAFQAYLNTPTEATGIWSEGASGVNNLELVVREGDPLPGAAGGVVGEIFDGNIYMNVNGAIVFFTSIIGAQDGFGPIALLRHDAQDGLWPIASPGQPVDLGCRGLCDPHLTDINPFVSINASGQVAFYAEVDGPGINDSNDSALFVGDGRGLAVALREGDAPPNTSDAVFGSATQHIPLLHDTGEVTVRNFLEHVSGDSIWTVLRGLPGEMQVIAAQAMPTPAGGVFAGDWFTHMLSGNNAGDVTFHQTVEFAERADAGRPAEFSWGMWARLAGSLEAIGLGGFSAPDGLVYADTPLGISMRINGGGTVLFQAVVAGDGIGPGNDAVWVRRSPDGSSQIIAQEGDPAPGLPGVVFASLYGKGTAALTASSGVLFTAPLVGGGTTDDAMYLTQPGGSAALLLYRGMDLEVNGQVKTVDAFTGLYGRGAESGQRPAMTSMNQVATRMTFTDGTQAIVVVTPPADCPGDADGDSTVDSDDLNVVLAAFGTTGEPGFPGDLDLDGDCDSADLNTVLAYFGHSC